MPHTASAAKRLRQSVKRTAANQSLRTGIRTVEKKVLQAVAAGDGKAAAALLPEAYQKLDKAASRHVIHANTAANHKARLARRVSQLTGKKSAS